MKISTRDAEHAGKLLEWHLRSIGDRHHADEVRKIVNDLSGYNLEKAIMKFRGIKYEGMGSIQDTFSRNINIPSDLDATAFKSFVYLFCNEISCLIEWEKSAQQVDSAEAATND